jgi:hypothetical protein
MCVCVYVCVCVFDCVCVCKSHALPRCPYAQDLCEMCVCVCVCVCMCVQIIIIINLCAVTLHRTRHDIDVTRSRVTSNHECVPSLSRLCGREPRVSLSLSVVCLCPSLMWAVCGGLRLGFLFFGGGLDSVLNGVCLCLSMLCAGDRECSWVSEDRVRGMRGDRTHVQHAGEVHPAREPGKRSRCHCDTRGNVPSGCVWRQRV